MKVLTKELYKHVELNEIILALSKNNGIMPVVFLNGGYEGVAERDIKTVKTQLDVTEKENQLSFMVLPSTFVSLSDFFEDAEEKAKHTPEIDFLSQYTNRLRIISTLPEEILKQVKDKRLLALGYADQQIRKSILKYAEERKIAAFKVVKNSLEDSLLAVAGLTIERQFEHHSQIYSVEALFDEAIITNVSQKGKDLYLELDHKETIVLTEVETLEEEIKPYNTCIRLFELHKNKQDYELHFLLATKDSNLIEYFHYVTYRFKDMRLI
ncbi:MAG: DUF4085 family protein [Clostridia bacterium]|nr:DUF4085 family protein [Clostridia bacterium]